MFAAIGGLGFAVLRGVEWPKRSDLRWWRMGILGALTGLNSAAFVFAIQHAQVGAVAAIAFTWPLWVVAAYWMVGALGTDVRVIAPLVVSCVGAAALVVETGAEGPIADTAGLLGAVVVAISMAGMVLLQRSTPLAIPSFLLVVVQSAIGSLFLMPAAVAMMDSSSIGLETVRSVAILGVGVTAFGGALFLVGLRRLTAPEAGALSYLEPIAATGIALIAFGERLSPSGIVGAVLMLGAAFVVLTKRLS